MLKQQALFLLFYLVFWPAQVSGAEVFTAPESLIGMIMTRTYPGEIRPCAGVDRIIFCDSSPECGNTSDWESCENGNEYVDSIECTYRRFDVFEASLGIWFPAGNADLSVDLTFTSATSGNGRWQGEPEGTVRFYFTLYPQELPDLRIARFQWDPQKGGLKYSFSVDDFPTPSATTIELFWATGNTASDRLFPAIQRVNINSGFMGDSGLQWIPRLSLRNAPTNVTHLLLMIDPDNIIPELHEENARPIPDVVVDFAETANETTVSEHTLEVIKDALRFAGEDQGLITSTYRTFRDQARIMFDVLDGSLTPKMIEKGFSSTVDYSYALYNRFADRVIDEYVAGVDAGETDDAIIDSMADVVDEVKAERPSLFPHTSDPLALQVVDVAPSSITSQLLFQKATDPSVDGRIQKRLSPFTKPVDIAFHIEVPQGVPSQNPERTLRPSAVVRLNASTTYFLPARTAATTSTLPILNGTAKAVGAVSSGRQIFEVLLSEGDIVSIGVEISDVYQGSRYADADSLLFLLDDEGTLVAASDDADPSDSDFESFIPHYRVAKSGNHAIVVSTFGNAPRLNAANHVDSWTDDGGSSIGFELVISKMPEKLGITGSPTTGYMISWGTDGSLVTSTDLLNWTAIPLASSPFFEDEPESFRFYKINSSP